MIGHFILCVGGVSVDVTDCKTCNQNVIHITFYIILVLLSSGPLSVQPYGQGIVINMKYLKVLDHIFSPGTSYSWSCSQGRACPRGHTAPSSTGTGSPSCTQKQSRVCHFLWSPEMEGR